LKGYSLILENFVGFALEGSHESNFGNKAQFRESFAEAISSLEPTVQNKQDCPEDSGHWELRGSDSEALLQSRSHSRHTTIYNTDLSINERV
jgi:hypothetical protein